MLLSFRQQLSTLTVMVVHVFAFACAPAIRFPVSTETTITLVKGDTVHQVQVLPKGERVQVQAAHFYHYFSGGQLGKAEGAYLGKPLHGSYQQHNRQKQLLEQGVFEKGLKIGEWRQWYPAGHLAAVENYKDGLANGKWIRYAPEGGTAWRRSYHKGLPDGKWIEYYPNSKPKSEESWREGVKHGDFIEYYASGALKRKGTYRKGELHGIVREYGETGTVFKSRYHKGEQKIKEEKPEKPQKGEKKDRSGKKDRAEKHGELNTTNGIAPTTEAAEQHQKEAKQKRGIRSLLGKNRKGSEAEETQPMLQNHEQGNKKNRKKIRWWPFTGKEKPETTTSTPKP
jgi:hypothetical protein